MLSLAAVVLAGLSLVASGAAHAAGTVNVRSSAAGEPILIDGVDTGLTTPTVIRNVAAGRHVFSVGGECRSGQADVIIPTDGKVVVNIDSAATTGSLRVQPTPSNATVKLDNKLFDQSAGAVTVPCGKHNLAVLMPGYVPAFLKVGVGTDERVVLPVELEAMGLGTLSLTITPDAASESASVVLDGAVISTAGQQLPAGPHVIQVSADGFVRQERQFVLADGQTLPLAFALVADSTAVVAAPRPRPPPKRDGPSWWTAPHTSGVVATAAGVGLGVVAVIELIETGQMGDEYNDRVDTVNTVRDYDETPPSYANNYHDNQLIPQRNKAVALTAVSTLLLASGLTLTLAF